MASFPKRMPTFFIGHGSPMNALATNEYSKTLHRLGKTISQPRAIVMISAHWMTKGTWVTHMKSPKTIHDFYGFPQELFDVQYPAPGAPSLAEEIQKKISSTHIELEDQKWGLDHGTWSVLTHLYPEANIPVIQLSLDMTQPASFHFHLGQQLQFLRDEGVLILGSGNIVHNLKLLNWSANAQPYNWAVQFDEWVKQKIISRDWSALTEEALHSNNGKLSVPTLEHYLPFLVILGTATESDSLQFVYEGLENASISMRSVGFGI